MNKLGVPLARMVAAATFLAAAGCTTEAPAVPAADASPADVGDTGPGGPDSGAIAACVALTLEFVGCDAERLAECEREYASFPAPVRALVDSDAACFRADAFFAPAAAWPASPDAAACGPPPSDVLDSRWYHGACQGQNSTLNGGISSLVCTGTTSGCGAAQSSLACSSLSCAWDAAAGLCTGIPCAQALSGCSQTPGCTHRGLPICGGQGQPACFFGTTLPCALCR